MKEIRYLTNEQHTNPTHRRLVRRHEGISPRQQKIAIKKGRRLAKESKGN